MIHSSLPLLGCVSRSTPSLSKWSRPSSAPLRVVEGHRAPARAGRVVGPCCRPDIGPLCGSTAAPRRRRARSPPPRRAAPSDGAPVPEKACGAAKAKPSPRTRWPTSNARTRSRSIHSTFIAAAIPELDSIQERRFRCSELVLREQAFLHQVSQLANLLSQHPNHRR